MSILVTMVLGPKLLLELVEKQKLVENLSERELTNPEGAGFDLRLGEIYKIHGKAFLGVTERQTPDFDVVASYQSTESQTDNKGKTRDSRLRKNDKEGNSAQRFTFEPGDFYLVKTIESVNIPQDLTASITPRSTTFRSGIFLRATGVHPGYSGGLIFGLKNEAPVPVTIELGARIAHIQFHEVKGGGSMYRGQWQGGRVSATEKETQV